MGEVYWAAGHPVLALLSARRDRTRNGTAFDDGQRLVLAVEGGGMRGIVSAAMLCAIEDLGFAKCFDEVVASSAGAVNATYFIGGGSWSQLSIYYDDLSTSDFIDIRRAFKGRPIVDLHYVFNHVMKHLRPPDLDAVLASPTRLGVAVTDVDALSPVVASEFGSADDLMSTLLASSWAPVQPFRTAQWRGRRALDGGVLVGHPLRLVPTQSCTHILSLSTRPIRVRPWPGYSLGQRVGYLHLERIRKGLGTGYLHAVREYWHDREAVGKERTEPMAQPHVLDLAPLPWMPEVKNHESDPGRLMAAARQAYGVMHCALNGINDMSPVNRTFRVVPRLTVVSV